MTFLKQAIFFLFIASCVILAAAKLYTVWSVRRAEKNYPPIGQFLNVNGVRMHYVRKGQGHPLVLIHGSFGSLYYFTHSIFDAASREYDAIAFDQPGYGYSERPPGSNMTLKDHAAYLREALKQLGIENPVLAAHSWGSGVALAYALEYPEDLSALVLINGYVRPAPPPVDLEYRIPIMPVIGKLFLECFFVPAGKIQALTRSGETFAPNAEDKEYVRVVANLALRPTTYQWNAQDVRNCSPSLRTMVARYGSIKVPVFIMTGDSDTVASTERHAKWLHEQIPGSQLTVLPQTGHQIAFARREETLKILREARNPIIQEKI